MIVGAALNEIAEDPQVAQALFEILEVERLMEGGGEITLVPPRSGLLAQMVASGAPALKG